MEKGKESQEEGGASRRKLELEGEKKGRAGVSEKEGVRDRWTKGEGGGSGTTDVLSLGQLTASSPAIVEV